VYRVCWYWTKFAVSATGLVGMVKMQGLASAPPEHAVPVTFQPENVQFGSATALTFIAWPTVSEQPDGHDGLVVPSPTVVVVRVEQLPPAQLMVTVSTGACLTNPSEAPLMVIWYCMPGVAFRALTTNVVTNGGVPTG